MIYQNNKEIIVPVKFQKITRFLLEKECLVVVKEIKEKDKNEKKKKENKKEQKNKSNKEYKEKELEEQIYVYSELDEVKKEVNDNKNELE